MSEEVGPQAAALTELVEWWQDVSQRPVGPQAVLLEVPVGWGRSTVLQRFAATVEADDAAMAVVVRLSGAGVPAGVGLQAKVVIDAFEQIAPTGRAALLLDVESVGGWASLGANVAGAASVVLGTWGWLAAAIGVTAARKGYGVTTEGKVASVGALADRVARASTIVPILVVIDDLDGFGPVVAASLVERLCGRPDGKVLVAMATDPSSTTTRAVRDLGRTGLAEGRVSKVEVSASMGFEERLALVRTCSGADVSEPVCFEIATRTRTLGEVLTVAAMPGLADPMDLAGTDRIIAVALDRPPLSGAAGVVALAGGLIHRDQLAAILADLGIQQGQDDGGLVRSGSLVRLEATLHGDMTDLVEARFDRATRSRLATIALRVAQSLPAGLTDPVGAAAAYQAVLATGGPVPDPETGIEAASALIDLFESLEDDAGVIDAVEWTTDHVDTSQIGAVDIDRLAAARIRAQERLGAASIAGPLVEALIDHARTQGASCTLEAITWASVALLRDPNRRQPALALVDDLIGRLGERPDLGGHHARWLLLVAYHAGKAGLPSLTQKLLQPLIDNPPDPETGHAAETILTTIGAGQADKRLQVAALEAELVRHPHATDDELLRLHKALADLFQGLGEASDALRHGQSLLELDQALLGPDHGDTLQTRHNIAYWTGSTGHPDQALTLYEALLPDLQRVLGPDHPNTLATLNNIASLTGQTGHPDQALTLYEALLPDQQRVLGPDHPDTLRTRNNIAQCTGNSGRPHEALALIKALLPNQQRVLGADHPNTLSTRGNIAYWTDETGHPDEALTLYEALLPDRQRVLGADHPDTLQTRHNIAAATGATGHPQEALSLYKALLPDRQRILGPDHPDTLETRNNVAGWTGENGQHQEALRLSQELLSDLERILGPDHPDTLTIRNNIAGWTGSTGHPDEALTLYEALLPDLQRVRGPDHPDTLRARNNIAYWTDSTGHPAEALTLYEALLPDQQRVLGPDHPYTLTTLNNIAHLRSAKL